MNEAYITLGKSGKGELVVKKSEFIGYASHIKNEEQALDFIASVRRRHADAKHNVYAYMLKSNNIMRYSDDKEPQGSAGVPVLDVIRKGGFTDAVIVVTRYFGGVLLGVGGLVRAYSAAAKLAVEDAGIVKYELFTILSFRCDYKTYPKIQSEISKIPAKIDNVEYGEDIEITISLPKDIANDFCSAVSELSLGKIQVENKGSRYDTR